MALLANIIEPVSKLLDRIIIDPRTRDEAKLALLKLQAEPDAVKIVTDLQPLNIEVGSRDPWTSRARPSFLYIMYVLILWSIPMGLIAAVRPQAALAISNGMTAYLRGIPDELYTLFGTGYLGYTVARTWGKIKGVDR